MDRDTGSDRATCLCDVARSGRPRDPAAVDALLYHDTDSIAEKRQAGTPMNRVQASRDAYAVMVATARMGAWPSRAPKPAVTSARSTVPPNAWPNHASPTPTPIASNAPAPVMMVAGVSTTPQFMPAEASRAPRGRLGLSREPLPAPTVSWAPALGCLSRAGPGARSSPGWRPRAAVWPRHC